MSIEIKEHSFSTGVVTINYAEGPAFGPPLVLLHGGSARWQNSESIMPDLAADWHLYAPEFRGHGKSGRVAGRYRLQDYADDTIAFLRQVVLPSIRCPVLLLQADPEAGGVMTDAEVEQGLPLLSQPIHVLLEGISHVLHNEQKEPVLRAITDFLGSL